MKVKLFIVAIICLLQSCSTTDFLDEQRVETISNDNNEVSYVIPLEDALKNVEKVLDCINGASVSRASSLKSVKNIQILSISNTISSRSSHVNADTAIYIVNYDDGFALLGADYRLDPIYAISTEGNFDLSDTIQNKGLALYINSLKSEITTKINSNVSNSRASIPEVDGNINSPYQITDIALSYKRGPYGKNRLWGQSTPFNYYCPTISGTKTLVGCVAVATGLIMAHHQHPDFIDGEPLNWTAIENGQSDLALFLYRLGGSKYLDMDYGILLSGALSTNVPKTLRSLGYSCGELETYDKDKIVAHYSESFNPIYMRGNTGSDDYGRYTGGHAWIIDGAMDIWMKYVMPGRLMETHAIYFYCNWGWEGSANGWYKHFSLAPVNGPELVEHGDQNSSVNYNFNVNIQMILDIKPL